MGSGPGTEKSHATMTTSRIGRGALVTLAGAAASMAGAAGAANACEKPPPPTNCTIDSDDVQYAPASSDGKGIVGQWQNARGPHHQFKALTAEPVNGIQVRLNPDLVDKSCQGSVDVSLASYTATGGTWETSGTQAFVGHTQTIPSLSAANRQDLLKVALPGSAGGPCYGQIDLYFGTKVYDGKANPLPHHGDKNPTPDQRDMITAWNGSDTAGSCVTAPPAPPVTSTTTTTPTSPASPASPAAPPSTSPTTHPGTTPSTPATTAPPPTPTSSTGTATPGTPATTTSSPGTPTLAHTGANVGEVSLVALAFFGAGGTAMFASRKAKTAGTRTH